MHFKGFNPFAADVLKSRGSKCFVAFFFAVLALWTTNCLKNAVSDFSGDLHKQITAMHLFFATFQV